MNELEQAVELAEQGWCVGSLVDDGKVCAAGAIYAAHKGYTSNMLAEMNFAQQNEFENEAARYVSTSESGAAFAQEIVERGLCNIKDAEDNYSIIWNFNDKYPIPTGEFESEEDYDAKTLESIVAHKYDVLEVMKHAAKRLNSD